MSDRAVREQRIARLLLVFAVLVIYAPATVLLVSNDRDRFDSVMWLCSLASIASCMTAMWLAARARGARHPLLWSLLGTFGVAGLGVLGAVLIVRRWVGEAGAAIRRRRARAALRTPA